jgi:hypothetical protein
MLRKLFAFSGAISRLEYAGIACAGVLCKHAIDLGVASGLFHREWTPLNYIVPLGIPLQNVGPQDGRFLLAMTAIALPFAWIGTAITVKRFRAIGWPLWTVAFFFVPIANVVSFAVAAVWPEPSSAREDTPPTWLMRIVPSDPLGAAILALALTALLSVALVALGTKVLGAYGWGLFAGVPFAQGAIASLLIGVHRRPSAAECILVALISAAVTFAALLAVALEGAVCLLMATPLAIAFTLMGAAFGYVVTASRGRTTVAGLLLCLLVAPCIMGAEGATPREAPLYRVETAIVVNAPPARVWRSVVSFPPLPPPSELPFRLGVAYPQRAHIVGSGVGAVRYCEFSTGAFVEPITVWRPGRELAFDVVRNPSPMRELSPYGAIETPHLHDYLTSRRGEFLLQPLSGGRTLLIGITWYRHHLWPAPYWAMFSNAIVHTIHRRVLDHVKALAEQTDLRG